MGATSAVGLGCASRRSLHAAGQLVELLGDRCHRGRRVGQRVAQCGDCAGELVEAGAERRDRSDGVGLGVARVLDGRRELRDALVHRCDESARGRLALAQTLQRSGQLVDPRREAQHVFDPAPLERVKSRGQSLGGRGPARVDPRLKHAELAGEPVERQLHRRVSVPTLRRLAVEPGGDLVRPLGDRPEPLFERGEHR